MSYIMAAHKYFDYMRLLMFVKLQKAEDSIGCGWVQGREYLCV